MRAGLSQTELGERVGRHRTQIARWERHAFAPSLETLRELVQACGYDLSLRLEPLDHSDDDVLRAALMLPPQERLQRMLNQRKRIQTMTDFDPLAILGALERYRVAYVIVGDLAGVLHGTDLTANNVEITPSLSRRTPSDSTASSMTSASRRSDGRPCRRSPESPSLSIPTPKGEMTLTAVPPGTGDYADLRRAAQREPLGQGIRAPLASAPDLIRSLAAEGQKVALEQRLRRLVDLERGLTPEM